MAQAIRLKNAHKMMTEVRVDKRRRVLRIRFADGIRGEIPLTALKGHEKLDLDRVELPTPYAILIGVQGESEPTGIPWDFARYYCDPEYAHQLEEWNKRDRHVLARNLRRLRTQRGWSQAELADHAAVSHITISRLESDGEQSPRMETLERLAEALGVGLADLF